MESNKSIDRKSFLIELASKIEGTLKDRTLVNYGAQIRAKSVGATFNASYDERRLWKDANFLAIYGSILLREKSEFERSGITAVRAAAEYFEFLSKVSVVYDNDYLKVLSALCYDISGYQANAYAMASKMTEYKLEEDRELVHAPIDKTQLRESNFVLTQILLILSKKLPHGSKLLSLYFQQSKPGPDSEYINLFSNGLKDFYSYALEGKKNNFLSVLNQAYLKSFDSGNHLTNSLLHLILVRLSLFERRSVWIMMQGEDNLFKNLWTRYLKLMAQSIYDGFRVKEISERTSRFEFWNSQIEAIDRGVISSSGSFVVQMPTSSGKTLIAEMAILNAYTDQNILKPKVLYVAPFRALVNQVENDLSASLGKLKIRVSSIVGGFEYDIFDQVMLGESDVIVTTPEKADMFIRNEPTFVQQMNLLIIDEGHVVGDGSKRSALLELLIIKFKSILPALKIIFISAVMPENNSDQIVNWISGNKEGFVQSPTDDQGESWSPTRKILGAFTWNSGAGRITYKNVTFPKEHPSARAKHFFAHNVIQSESYSYVNPQTKRKRTVKFPNAFDNKAETSAMLAYKLAQNGPTLIFSSRPDWAMAVGEAYLRYLHFLEQKGESIDYYYLGNSISDAYSISKEWYGEDHIISRCLLAGIGIHYGRMIKSLRLTIEDEFKKGRIRVLISTNTIGQGLNFPIKNLIFHSLEINPQKANYLAISIRDFWNIIGRAGRAGRETEGHIAFLCLNRKDLDLFNKYTKKSNLEPIESTFYGMLKKLIDLRITDIELKGNLEKLLQPTVLQLLCEEGNREDFTKISDLITTNSLYQIQIEADQKLDNYQSYISDGVYDISSEIAHRNYSDKKLKAFAKTGLPVSVCEEIYDIIETEKELYQTLIFDNEYEQILERIIDYLFKFKYESVQHDSLNNFSDMGENNFKYLVKSWVEGSTSDALIAFWDFVQPSESTEGFAVIISEGFEYIFPWLSSSFIEIIGLIIDMSLEDFSREISSIPTYLKYGANNEATCFMLSLGFRSRDIAIKITAQIGLFNTPQTQNWLSTVTRETLEDEGFSDFAIKEVFFISNKLASKNFNLPFEKVGFNFFVVGTRYTDNMWLKSIQISDQLFLNRDYTNQYDPNAIEVLLDKVKIGFMPREEAKYLAPLIDIDQKEFLLTVLDVKVSEDGIPSVKVKLLEA